MKMPDEPIAPVMFAPCGMNCMVCYKHCCHKKPCGGCLDSDSGKPEHCRKCKIKECAKERGHTYCYGCEDFPCKMLKSLDKSYQNRYGVSLVENSAFVQSHGIAAFMDHQKEVFTCKICSGVISLHDAWCSECGKNVK